MNSVTYSVIIPAATVYDGNPWRIQPNEKDPNWKGQSLARGSFKSEQEAHEWASTNIPGIKYTIRTNPNVEYI